MFSSPSSSLFIANFPSPFSTVAEPSINFSPKDVLVCPERSEASAANFIFLLFHFRTKLSAPLLKTDYSPHHSLSRFQQMVFSGKHQDLPCKDLFSVSSREPFLLLLEGAETVSLQSCSPVAQTSKRETLNLLEVSSASQWETPARETSYLQIAPLK